MSQTKKDYIDLTVPFRIKFQFRVTRQIFMNARNGLPRIALAVNKNGYPPPDD